MSPCGSAGWWPRGLQTPLCIQALPKMEGLAPLKVILGIPQAHQHPPNVEILCQGVQNKASVS